MPPKARTFATLSTIVLLLLGSIDVASQSQEKTFCVLHDFGDPKIKDGVWPDWPGTLTMTDDGSVWTAVNRGGAFTLGAVIKIAPDATYTKVADFDAFSGAHPQGGLVNGNNGYLFGTTSEGGRWGFGTIFRISVQGGRLEVIYDFRNGRSTGIQPKGKCTTPQNCEYSPEQRANMSAANPVSSPVVVGENLYGVTPYSNHQQYGTLYTIPLNTAPRANSFTGTTPEKGDEGFKVRCIFQPSLAKDPEMKQFRCNTNGTNARLLIAGAHGELYGTTYTTETGQNGTIFRAAAAGGLLNTLHEFSSPEGSRPVALIQASDYNLYGTTANGGRQNTGVLFKLNTTTHEYKVITDFPKPSNNEYLPGSSPVAGVVEGEDGNLYGALQYGGLHGGGMLFRVAREDDKGDYDFRVLRDFEGSSSGVNPISVAALGKGVIYGTTFKGGAFGGGTLYRYQIDRVAVGGGTIIPTPNPIEIRKWAMATQERAFFDSAKEKDRDEGIAVRLKCDNDPHFVQFIHREVIQLGTTSIPPGNESHPNGKLLSTINKQPLGFKTSCDKCSYAVTSDLNDIHWAPDALDAPGILNGLFHAGSPYFEGGHSAELDCDALTLFDRPEIRPEVAAIFFFAPNVVQRAVVRDYAICGGQVVRQITWIADQTLDQAKKPHWQYQATVSTISNNKIPDYFLCLLKNDGYPLPAGQSIGAGIDCAHLPAATATKP